MCPWSGSSTSDEYLARESDGVADRLGAHSGARRSRWSRRATATPSRTPRSRPSCPASVSDGWSSSARRPIGASARRCTAPSSGATTRSWSAMPTRRRIRRLWVRRRRTRSLRTRICTGQYQTAPGRTAGTVSSEERRFRRPRPPGRARCNQPGVLWFYGAAFLQDGRRHWPRGPLDDRSPATAGLGGGFSSAGVGSVKGHECFSDGKHVAADLLTPDTQGEQTRRDALDKAPLPDRALVDTRQAT